MNQRKRIYNTRILILAFAFLLAAVFFSLKWKITDGYFEAKGEKPDFVSAGFNIEYDFGRIPDVHYSDGGFFVCTKDGIKRYDTAGGLKWDYPLSLSEPKMTGDGGYVIVSENKGSSASVFSEEGFLYAIELKEKILSQNITNTGYAIVMASGENGDYQIKGYNPQGILITESKEEQEGVFPVAMDLSNDGRIAAIGYLNTNGLNVTSVISFFYLKESEAAGLTDGMFASTSVMDGEIISKINFIGENKLVYFTDARIGCAETGTGNYLKKLWETEVQNEINQKAYIDQGYVAVAMGKELAGKSGYKEGTVVLFSVADGKIMFEYEAKGSISYLAGGKGHFTIGTGSTGKDVVLLNTNGDMVWEYRAVAENSRVIMLDSKTKILCYTPLNMTILEKNK